MKTPYQAIIDHKEVYEMAHKPVPPYRITCKEHKALVLHMQEFLKACGWVEKKGMIAQFMGVDIEVVMRVDEYF